MSGPADNKEARTPGLYGCSRRQAKQMLLDRAGNLRREAERLEVLANALPGILPADAEDALFDLITERRR